MTHNIDSIIYVDSAILSKILLTINGTIGCVMWAEVSAMYATW